MQHTAVDSVMFSQTRLEYCIGEHNTTQATKVECLSKCIAICQPVVVQSTGRLHLQGCMIESSWFLFVGL